MRKSIKNLSMTVLILLATLLFSTVAYAAEIPAATDEFYVNDFADVFTAEEEERLLDNAVTLAEESDGIQVVVTTVESLDGDSDDKEQRLKAILTQIEQWVERASKFKNIKMKNVCEFLSKHAQRIIYASVLDYRISNSVVEGINSHAKLLQRIHKGQIQVPTYICLLHRSFPGKVA